MHAENSRDSATESKSRIVAAQRDAMLRRRNFQSSNDGKARGLLVEALIALAGESVSKGDETAATAALDEAEALIPTRRPGEIEWRGRTVMLQRVRAALAQRQNAHADAVRAFEAALAEIPSDLSRAGRDGNAARLQLLVHLARSRLALGQARKAVADMGRAEKIMAALDGAIPPRAIETVRAAVLANAAIGLSMLGQMEAAEAKFATSIAAVDRLGMPELAELRTQVLDAWAGALRNAGRAADSEAMLAAFGNPSRHVHSAACGCGHNHAAGHGHSHHHHGEDCGCASHPD